MLRSTVETDRFLSLLAQAEDGAPDVLPEMRRLVCESDSVGALLEQDDTVAVRYALVEDTL